MNKTRSKLSETQNFLASPRMYALNANAPNSIKPRRRFKAARQWITAPLKTSRSVWTDVFNAPTLLLLSRNSSAYLQYQRSAGEVTIQEAERKQRGTHERTKNYAQTSPPSRAFTSFFPSRCRLDRGHGQKKHCAISFPSLDSRFISPWTFERERHKRCEEGIVLGEYKFGKLDRSSFAVELAFETDVLVLRFTWILCWLFSDK